ncbi:hypothetical protein D3C73_1501020 [compost metagenome]
MFHFLASGFGLALFARVALDGGAPARLGEDLFEGVHQVVAIEPGLEVRRHDLSLGKQIGASEHLEANLSGRSIKGG